jgi:hypothetical protein
LRVAGLVVVGEDLERGAAAGPACFEVASAHVLGGCPVAAVRDLDTGGGGGDVGVNADRVQLVGLAQAVVVARRWWILAEQTGHNQTLPHVSKPQ